jgi:hypothetical protein
MRVFIVALLMTLWLCVPASASADSEVARVKTFTGTASIQRGDKTVTVANDEKIYKGDTLKTGKDGALGIIFRDNTVLSMGPGTTAVVDDFLFAPTEGKFSMVIRMLKGTASCLSGVIAKLSPQSVRFETPVATVGIRGTKFLVAVDEEETP